MIHSLAFSGAGSWSNEDAIASYNASHKEVLTRSIILNLMSGYGKKRGGTYQLPGNTGYPNQCIFVFDPEFETYCDEMAQKLVANKTDKNIIGYFETAGYYLAANYGRTSGRVCGGSSGTIL